MTKNNIEIRDYKADDQLSILRLFQQIFNIKRSINRWNWQFKDHIQGPGWITLALEANEIVGQYCVMRNHLNFMGREIVAGQSCDTMIRSDQSGKGLFKKITEFNYEHAKKKMLRQYSAFLIGNHIQGLCETLNGRELLFLNIIIIV